METKTGILFLISLIGFIIWILIHYYEQHRLINISRKITGIITIGLILIFFFYVIVYGLIRYIYKHYL
jgi:hypothetical protein